jgi:predicted GNAT family acetyltransferase
MFPLHRWSFAGNGGIIVASVWIREGREVIEVRILRTGEEGSLEEFLLPRIESSMFLLGNLRAAGLTDRGQSLEGTYAAAFEAGKIVAVVAHYWNGNLVFQAPDHVAALARAAVEASGRAIQGLIGPQVQVGLAKEALRLDAIEIMLDETEYLYSLALTDLVVPEALRSGQLRGRRIEPRDLDLLTRWRVGFSLEALGEEPSDGLWERCRASAERSLDRGTAWILEEGGKPVATSSFNAATAEAVQIGGVWTPPELRSRGYGRAVVAASLLDARAQGVMTSILFTGVRNVPAQRAYVGLGFRHIGDYRLLLLHPPS